MHSQTSLMLNLLIISLLIIGAGLLYLWVHPWMIRDATRPFFHKGEKPEVKYRPKR